MGHNGTPNLVVCDRCEREFHQFLDDMRMWAGRFTEFVDGEEKVYEQLCDDCHAELERS